VSNQDKLVWRGGKGTIRTLRRHEELPLLREHLLRLDHNSRHDRFHGFMDDSFIESYAGKCASDGTLVVAYLEDGVVRGAAELHPPDGSPDSQPEIAFSVEAPLRRKGVGSMLFRKLIAEARAKGYRRLRITTGTQNQAMRALAGKFGARLTFRHGESTGSIDLAQQDEPARLALVMPLDVVRAMINLNRAYWGLLMRIYGWGWSASSPKPGSREMESICRQSLRVRGAAQTQTVTPHPNPLPPQVGPARLAQNDRCATGINPGCVGEGAHLHRRFDRT
jgi:GNAT superfamily N-acetyltransferase